MTRSWFVGSLFGCLILAMSAAGEQSGGLPAEECVQGMRGARIAGMHGDTATELTKLQASLTACPGEIAPIYALMDYYRRQPHLEEGHKKFQGQLLQRLQDPSYDLPAGVLEYLIRDPDIEDSELEAILDNLARQLAAAKEPDPGLMRIKAHLQLRLARFEGAALTLEGLRQESDPEGLLRVLYPLYVRLDRWQDAAKLLEPLIEDDLELRFFYIRALAELGRFEEVMKQVEIFSASAASGGPSPGTPIGDDAERIVLATLQSGYDDLMRQVAWDLHDQGQDAKAEQVFRDLLKKTPESPALRAIVLNLYAGAEERQSHATSLADRWQDESDPNALLEEGTQRLTAGDAAGAIDLLRRAAPEFPDLEAVWYNLGMAAYRLEDWATVDSALGRAGELNPSRTEAFVFRGIALAKLKKYATAVQALERAVELDPGRGLCHYYLSISYQQLGDKTAAAAARARYEASKE